MSAPPHPHFSAGWTKTAPSTMFVPPYFFFILLRGGHVRFPPLNFISCFKSMLARQHTRQDWFINGGQKPNKDSLILHYPRLIFIEEFSLKTVKLYFVLRLKLWSHHNLVHSLVQKPHPQLVDFKVNNCSPAAWWKFWRITNRPQELESLASQFSEM